MQDIADKIRSIIKSVGGLTPEEAEELNLKYEKAEALSNEYKDKYQKAEARIAELEGKLGH